MKRILWAILVMAISTNLPAPLFPVYQQNYGLTPLVITTLFALYAACLLPMLLISGSITDRKGKKAVVLMGIFFACLSALCFAIAKGAAMLYLARMLEGFGIGLFMGTSNALLVENTKEHVQSALGYASMFNMFGFGFGPLLCGIIAEYSSAAPYRLPYLLLLAGLLAAIVLVFTIREGTNETAGPLKIKIGLGVPKENRKIFWKLIAPAAFLMLALNGVVISLIPTYVKPYFTQQIYLIPEVCFLLCCLVLESHS